MTNDVAVDTTATDRTVRRSRLGNRVLWVVQILVGLDFMFGATMKILGFPNMLDLFDRIGAGQWLRYFVAACELAGGIGLMIPALCGLAALGLSALMVGASYVNIFLIDDSWAPVAWLVLVGFIAWRRWPRTKALFTRSRTT